MKRIILIVSLFLFITANLFSAAIREERKQKEYSAKNFTGSSVPARPGSSVWKVTKGGNTLYLGGSVHILREIDFPLPAEYDYAFFESEVQVLEADTEQMENPEIMQYMFSQMMLPEGVLLHSLLEPEVYDHLTEVCSKYEIPIYSVEKIKPSILLTMLTIQQIEKLGFKEKGIDDYFLIKAKTDYKPVLFLESLQTQIDMLASMGEGYENEYVSYSLMDLEHTEDALETMLLEWRYGLSSLNEETLIEMKADWPELYKKIITDRHDAWMPQIENFIASGKIHFVVTGLLHMHGPDGLRQRLKNSGYTVEQVIVK